MGLVYADFIVKKDFESEKKINIKFLIDSGAVYSLIPGNELEKIDVKPNRTKTFVLADGTEIKREVGDAFFEWQGEHGFAPVIFGKKGETALLGATTLEALGLVLNPFSKEITPMKLMLA